METEEGLLKHFILGPLGEWRRMLLGAFSFWLPDIIYHYVRKSELSEAAIWEMTAVMPILTLIAYIAVRLTTGSRNEDRRSVAISMLLGIWVLAPAMISIGTTFAGAGLRSGSGSLLVVILGTVLFPIYTLIMAGYDLTIPALFLVTILLVGAHFAFERTRM
jgi:hypothetical protein